MPFATKPWSLTRESRARSIRRQWALVFFCIAALRLVTHSDLRGFSQPLVKPVGLLVAVAPSKDGKEYLALSVTGEAGCAENPKDLVEELEAWAPSQWEAVTTYRTVGCDEVRERMNGLWDEGRLLVSCYEALAWLRTGEFPKHDEPLTAEDVLESLSRVLERPSNEATDHQLRQWIRKEYGKDGLQRLLAAAKDPEKDAVHELKELFSWFREHFPYYHGACDSCKNESTHFIGVARPSDVEREDGGAGVCEFYFCQGCNSTSRFPRFRRVPPVLKSHKGRCGEYAWLAVLVVEALGFEGRWVDNHAGHVWAEVLLPTNRWVHLDPCEAAIDEPLLYAHGWGRCPLHVLAYQANASEVLIEDVTMTYRPSDAKALPKELAQNVKDAIAKALSMAEEQKLTLALVETKKESVIGC